MPASTADDGEIWMTTDRPGSDPSQPGAQGPRPPEPVWATPPPPSSQPSAWGASAQGPAPLQPHWGDSPPGQPGWNAPPPPGQPPQQGWGAPPPARSSGNGCLKACLIVGLLLVALAIIAIISLFAVGSRIVSGLGVDSSGNLRDCSIVSASQVRTALGPDAQVGPLSGLANTIGGVALDKRVLPDAENCWIGIGSSPGPTHADGEFGRIAKYSGADAASRFDQARSAAQTGRYFATDVAGADLQAFCTGWSNQYPGTGALVRKGSDLVYVSFFIGPSPDLSTAPGDNGVRYSAHACASSVALAQLALP